MRRIVIVVGLLWSAHAVADVAERPVAEPRLQLPERLTDAVRVAFPDYRAVGKHLLAPSWSPNLLVTARTSVSVTFLSEVASFHNSLGYFAYEIDGGQVRILERGLVFPNATPEGWGGLLHPGDTVTLRDASGFVRYFDAGTHLGFFLVSNGWTGSTVRGWEPGMVLPSAEAAHNQDPEVFSSLDILNPEMAAGRPDLARHAALLRVPGISGFLGDKPFLVLGFEDWRRDRGSDEDFNDLMCLVHADLSSALGGTRAPLFDPAAPDADGDGVVGLSDAFANDAARATIRPHWRAEGMLGADAETEEILDAQEGLKDIQATFHRSGQAAEADLVLRGLPIQAQGTLRLERYTASGGHTVEHAMRLGDLLSQDEGGKLTFRLPGAFLGGGVSGQVESLRVVLTFDQALPASTFAGGGSFPWELESKAAVSESGGVAAPWQRTWELQAGEE